MGAKALGMGGHHSARMQKDEWLTPPELIHLLGPFDLDPCSPGSRRPWDTAKRHLSLHEHGDGLLCNWEGRVWLNPPYGSEAGKWLAKLAEHGDGIALIFARTETEMFFNEVWSKADALLFLKGRLYFHHVDGQKAAANAGAPSVLVAYGQRNARVLSELNYMGQFVPLQGQLSI